VADGKWLIALARCQPREKGGIKKEGRTHDVIEKKGKQK
jgi:hypothetical protein